MIKVLQLSAAAITLLLASGAQAAVFDFSGDCDDCAGTVGDNIFQPVTATFTVGGDVIGGKFFFGGGGISTFEYSGSNLLNPFTATHQFGEAQNGVLTTSGTLEDGPGFASFFMVFDFFVVDGGGPICTAQGVSELGNFTCAFASGIEFYLQSDGFFAIDLDDSGAPADFGINASLTPSVIPVPAAVWLFASGLLGLVGVARRND